jgi:WD40 repeat protein
MASKLFRIVSLISVGDVASGKEIRNCQAHPSIAFKLALSPGYCRLVSFGEALVKVWDTSTWREITTLSNRERLGTSTSQRVLLRLVTIKN